MMAIRRFAAAIAGLALVVGLLGAGLSASYTDSASAVQDITVGTFGIEVSSGQGTVSPDRHSVTFAVAAINASAPWSYSVPFTVTNVGSVPASITLSQTLPSAPFTSLLGPVAEFTLASGEFRDFVGGLGWPELGNEALGQNATITYTFDASEVPPGPTQVTPVAPTAIDESCDGSAVLPGSITIPSVVGVDYDINGTPYAAGTYPLVDGGYSVNASPQQDPNVPGGYELVGPTTWDLSIEPATCVNQVTPTIPAVADATCVNPLGSITIPDLAGTRYHIRGVYYAPGVYALAPDTGYTITVQAEFGYVLGPDDPGSYMWSLTIDPAVCIEFVGVASAAASGYTAANTVALPVGWQPGDTAIVFAANGPTTTAPVVPAGWVPLAGAAPSATYTGSGTNNTTISAVSRVGSRVLQAGDTSTGIWTNARRIAVVVYRNVGSVGPAASTGAGEGGSVSGKYITFPALTTTSPSSWLVGLGYLETTVQPSYWTAKTITAPAGTTSRTTSAAAATSTKLAVIDSNGVTTGWASRTVTTGFTGGTPYTSAAMNGITLELKVAP